jgi:peptide/nickel transport system permease protein
MVRGQASGGNMQSTQANVESLNEWKKERHLDRHWVVQYGYWLRDLARFDLGRSFLPPRQKVSSLIAERLPITLILNLIAFFLIYLVALPIGIIGAARQFTLWDRVSTVVVFLLYSLPAFWIGTLMLAFLCSPGGFPTTGYHGSTISELGFFSWIWKWAVHLTLPIVCMTYAGFAFISRQMRSALLEQIRQDFVRTARAKGLSERAVVLRHACRNALIPIVTLFGSLLPELISGAIIIEQLFSIPGMGQQFFQAIIERDYPVVMGIETVSAVLTLVGILVSDLLYVAVNPAITYE